MEAREGGRETSDLRRGPYGDVKVFAQTRVSWRSPCRYVRQQLLRQETASSKEEVVAEMAYTQYDQMVAMLNETMGLCLR